LLLLPQTFHRKRLSGATKSKGTIEFDNGVPIAMFSIFKRLLRKDAAAGDLHPTAVNRMSLEQRQAYRQEMLYQAVRETFQALEVAPSMYKFKVMPMDARHHRFITMIDVAKSFVSGRDSRTKSFTDVEKWMRTHTYDRYGVLIVGVYWRVDEAVEQFATQSRASDAAVANSTAALQALQARKQAAEVPAQGSSNAPLARERFQPVSPEEAQAFREALRQGVSPPPVQIGNMEYKSDLAPLDDGIMIGGTQYGKLS
jgi:hypothetical protein